MSTDKEPRTFWMVVRKYAWVRPTVCQSRQEAEELLEKLGGDEIIEVREVIE